MKKFTLLSFSLAMLLLWSMSFAQDAKKSTKGVPSKFDTRVDNMGYWMEKAKEGLVPYNPPVPVKPEEFKGSEIFMDGVLVADSPDVPVTNLTNVTETENSIFVDPDNNQYILNSNNSTSWSGSTVGTLYGANYFQSANGGTTWGGSYQGAGGSNSGDPTTAINLAGRQFVNYIDNPGGQGIAYSDDGITWTPVTIAPNPGSLADKNHMWIDNSPSSTYVGNLYVAWTDFGGSNNNNIVISRSTNAGLTWSSLINLSSAVSAGSHNQGVNIQTGPQGQVYVCWAIYDGWPTDESAIGFAKSTNGGVSYGSGTRIITSIKGIRNSGSLKSHRVNSFPSMAVDISGGSNNGNIYIVWTNIGTPGVNTGTNRSVYMKRSSDGGSTWSSAIRVNQGTFLEGKSSYFPWITCDPATGALAVIFYDDRNTSSSSCETWVAYSLDAGNTWTDFRVSDASFTPTAISGLASSYMGDYLGIAARGNYFYPCWTQPYNGTFMTMVSPFTLGLNAAFTANNTTPCTGTAVTFTDQSSGPPTSWSWSFPGGTPSTATGVGPHTITYNTAGTYNVSLTVGDGSTTDTETKSGYITVQNVYADFSGTPTTVVIGNTVTFTDNSGCSPTSWSWSFPGGTPSTATGAGPHVITYNTLGTYDVSLTVSKSSYNDTETKTGYITVTPPEFNMANTTVTTCTGNFYDSGGASGSYVDNENYTMIFYPSTTGAMIRFVFNTFSTESGYDYLRIYNGTSTAAPLIGTYNGTTGPGTVTASNASGALTFNFTSDGSVTSTGWSASISCYSTTQPPVADFSASTVTPPLGTTVTFSDLSTNIPTSWSWSFTPSTITYVNGTSSASQNPQVQFNALGQYTVSLIATNAYGSDNETKTNYINVVNCSYCSSSATTYNEEWISNVTFNTINNTTTGTAGYNDYTGIVTNVTKGTAYTSSVSCGSTGAWAENIWIFIDFNQDCDFVDTGESFDLGQVTGTGTLSLSITIPTNATSGTTRMRVSLKYSADPTSCESFSYGEVEDYTLNIQSGTGGVPVANFSASNATPFTGETVTFSDLTTNVPTAWTWSFNPTTITFVGGTNANSQNPQVQFNAAGYYTVTLSVSNTFGSDSETKSNYINVFHAIPPYADGFESFASGNYVALTSPYWTTWSDLPGGTEDAVIVTTPTHTGTKSVKIDGVNDLVLPMGAKTSGKFVVSFYMYVPSGYYGYYNLLQSFNGTSSEWGAEIFFNTGGAGYGNAGGSNSFTFTYAYNTWLFMKNVIDLDNDIAQIYMNGTLLKQWQWSLGALGSSSLLQLDGIDMFAWNVNGTPLYYFDDISYYEIAQVDMTVLLQGPYNGTAMVPYLSAVLPLTQPYNVAPWNYNGTESVTVIPNANIIDWILIELRDAPSAGQATSGTMVSRQAAFILNNGKVVGTDGSSVLRFEAPIFNNLYAVVHHRNHISVMSASGLTKTLGIYTYNFSTGAGQAYGGTSAHKQIAPGVWGMFGGDGTKDGSVGLTDESPSWEVTAGTKGYLGTDYNLNTQSDNKDKDDIWAPNLGAGSQVPN